MEKLTPKQKLFIDNYMVNFNATEAAKRAGYSERTAFKQGCCNLKIPKIKAEIDRRMKPIEEEALVRREEVIEGIRAIVNDPDSRNSDKLKGLELLGKHIAMFSEKTIHEGTQQVEVVVLPDDED